MQQASSFIQEMAGPSLPHIYEKEDVIDGFVRTLNNAQVQVVGPELIFGTLFDRIGYNAIGNEMFRNIVICRLFNPDSKLKTVDYLERYLHVSYSVDQIYRFLDNLCYRKDKEGGLRFHYYAHLSEINTHVGAYVTQKSVIGKVGNTGNAEGKPSHLHYSIATITPQGDWRWDPKMFTFFVNPIEEMK